MCIVRVSLLVMAIAILQALPAFAAEERRDNNFGAGAVPEVDYAASKAAQQRLAEARQRKSAADSGLITSVANLKKEFEAGAEWQATSNELKQATTEFEKARLPILLKLRNSEVYKSTEADKKKLAEELEKLRADSAGPDKIMPVATKLMQANAAMTKMEGDAVAADPSLAGLRKRMMDASAKLSALRKQFDESIKTSAAWQQARQEQDSAYKAIADAQKDLREAQAKEAQLERERETKLKEAEVRERDEELRKHPPRWFPPKK